MLIGKLGILHSSLILNPGVDFPVGIVSEEPLVVFLPGFVLGGRCFIILHLVWIVIVVLLGGLRDRKLLITVSTHTLVRPLRLAVLGGVRLLSSSCSPSDAYSTVADSSSSSTVDEYTLGYDLNRFIFKTTVNGDDSAVLRRQRR
jgi:hypothetical protein